MRMANDSDFETVASLQGNFVSETVRNGGVVVLVLGLVLETRLVGSFEDEDEVENEDDFM